jgi:hypothetical protein
MIQSKTLALLFRRTWPGALLAAGLAVTVAWIGLLGFGLFQIGVLAF